MKRIALTGAVLLGAALSFNAIAAAPPTPEEKAAADITDRQAVFKLLRLSNAALGAAARANNADAAKVALDRMQMLAKMIPEVLTSDTRAFKATKTRASDTIWDNKADFDKLAGDLQATLKEVADKGAAGLASAAQTIGPKCGACHDRFRLN
ncbi:MAG TPA: cytochrome c [Candidatus Acidoferrum sp.]|nr:cytochrome c [Candidatus Acidoferrum sp.]